MSNKAFKYFVWELSKKKFEASRYSLIIIFIETLGLYKSSYVADFNITWNNLSRLLNLNSFPKHRFKKFIKDIVSGTIERNEIIIEELDKNLDIKFNLNNMDKIFQVILKSATYEFLYKPNLSINIIIKEYLNASNFFLNDSQTKYLNALLDGVAKKLRTSNAWIWTYKKIFFKII